MSRITAIVSGDVENHPDDYLVLPESMDVHAMRQEWDTWYHGSYCRPLGKKKYVSFVNWLLNHGARRATSEEVTIFEDY